MSRERSEGLRKCVEILNDTGKDQEVLTMTSRRFWTITLLLLVVVDVSIRILLDFDFGAVLKAESFLFVLTAAVLFLRMHREVPANAWPHWVRSLIIVALLLAVVRAGSYSLGLELYLANLATLAIAIIAALGWRFRRRLAHP